MTSPAAPLPRSTPEAQGIPSASIGAFLDAVDEGQAGLHTFMLLRHGRVVADGAWEPYALAAPHMLFSLSKSFTSTAVGMAVAEGRLSIDDPLLSFFPAETPPRPSANLAAMRVRHLLAMSTGHDQDTTERMIRSRDGDWARAFLSQDVAHAPGTHFLYNTGATYMLSAIVQRLTGRTLLEYLGPRLFEPLGISGATWETCPAGVNAGGYGLALTTDAIARFGQLYLQRGRWDGGQLLPAAWVDEATSLQTVNGSNPLSDWEQGYGYQFWLSRHNAYRADGAFGQFCVVLPEQDAVIAIMGGSPDMQAVLDLIWTHLLPAFGPAALPEDRAGHASLERRLAALALPGVAGEASSATAEAVAGWRYVFGGKRGRMLAAVRHDFGPEADAITLEDESGEHRIACGHGSWARGETRWNPVDPRPGAPRDPLPIAAAGGWTAGDVYEARVWFTGTPFCCTLISRFTGREVSVKLRINVSFGPTEFRPLVGIAG